MGLFSSAWGLGGLPVEVGCTTSCHPEGLLWGQQG